MQDLNSLILFEPSAPVRQKASCGRKLTLERSLVVAGKTRDGFAVKRLHNFDHKMPPPHEVTDGCTALRCPTDAVGRPAWPKERRRPRHASATTPFRPQPQPSVRCGPWNPSRRRKESLRAQ